MGCPYCGFDGDPEPSYHPFYRKCPRCGLVSDRDFWGDFEESWVPKPLSEPIGPDGPDDLSEIDVWLHPMDVREDDDRAGGLRRYQGARVECFESGVFHAPPPILKYDVSSMYPILMVLTNASPENTKVVGRAPYTGAYLFDAKNGIVEVPDSYLGQVRVQIGAEDSVTRKVMLDFAKMRADVKKQQRSSRSPTEVASLDSRQQAVKLAMNVLYGYNGLEYSRYGSFAVALVTTAIGRFVMDRIIEVCRERGNTLLECDTDGVLVQGEDCSAIVNARLREVFADYKYVDHLKVEAEAYDAAIIYKAKNYVLRKDGKSLWRGSSFHGRHMPPICRTALERFADAIFDKQSLQDVWSDFADLRKFSLKDFTMSVKLNKRPDLYDDVTMYADLSSQLERPVWGEDVYYVKTIHKDKSYVPLGVVPDDKLRAIIDHQYYMDRIRDVVGRLLEPVKRSKHVSRKLADWCLASVSLAPTKKKLKVALIQVDGKWHNLALLKLGRFHKDRGDDVVWIDLSSHGFDRLYGSKIFMGGSGYDISSELPPEIEHLCPDYEAFKMNYSVGFTSRGCPRNCAFCIVREKEGNIREWADFNEFLRHQRVILLDNNFLASPKWKEKLQFLIDYKIKVSFCQGLDIRLINDENAELLGKVSWYSPSFKQRRLYFAFDHPSIEPLVRRGVEILKQSGGILPKYLMFFMLTNFNTTWDEDWHRFQVLEELGVDPFVMIYDRKNASQKKRDFARWVNQRRYKKCSFDEYDRSK